MDVNKSVKNDENSIKGLIQISDEEYERYNVQNNDLFFTRTSETSEEIGLTSAYIGNFEKCIFSGFILRARPIKEFINSLYFAYYLRSPKMRNEIIKLSSITTRALISGKNLSTLKVKIPDINEQEKVANFFSLVDKKIELMEKKYKLLENYKNGIMNLIFRKKVFFEDLNSWKLKKIKEIGNISTGNTPSTKNKEFYHPETYLWVTPSDITKSKYITNTARKLSIEGSKKGKFVEKNSVLVTCIASIGKNCIIPVNGYFNQQINSITPNEENNSDFIYYLISFNAKKMKQYAGITATPILNKKDFENMYFEFPPLKEQEKIADFLSENDNKIDYVEQQLEKTKEFKKYLLQQMFV